MSTLNKYVGRKLLSWDESEITDNEVEYRMEEAKDNKEEVTEDEVRQQVYNGDCYQFAWDDMVDYLTELMAKNEYWKASVNNFGWRSLDGKKYFTADTGSKLLSELLPNTDCTFYIYKYRNGFAIQNYHHDSPMGNEWYYIKPIKESTYEKYS